MLFVVTTLSRVVTVVCAVLLSLLVILFLFFFFKQKTAYEMRISDWSSDVCSSDLAQSWAPRAGGGGAQPEIGRPAQSVPPLQGRHPYSDHQKIGRASCRERVCQYV